MTDKYSLEIAPFGGYNIRHEGTLETLNFQFDWDFPRLAESFGARIICECGETDGTVDCDHMTASEMIQKADEWLFDNEGAETNGTFGDYPSETWESNQ